MRYIVYDRIMIFFTLYTKKYYDFKFIFLGRNSITRYGYRWVYIDSKSIKYPKHIRISIED